MLLVFPSKSFAYELFLFSLRIYNGPKRNWKKCLCKLLEGQAKSMRIFAYMELNALVLRRKQMTKEKY